jgi:predicted RNA-binding protein
LSEQSERNRPRAVAITSQLPENIRLPVIPKRNSGGKEKNKTIFGELIMCELNVIMLRGDIRERVMDSVAKILVEGNSIQLTGILGDRMTVEGSLKEVNLSRGEALILAD